MTPAAPDRRPEQLLTDSCQHLDGAISAASRNQQCHRPVGDQRCPQPPVSVSNVSPSVVTTAAACAVLSTAGGHPQIPGTGSYSLPLDEILLSQMLKSKGYATHIVGKWCVAPVQRPPALLSQRAVLTHGCAWILRRHLGVYKWESTPSFRGFDSFYGYYHGAEDYFNRKNATLPAL
jgi:hypothetical protein